MNNFRFLPSGFRFLDPPSFRRDFYVKLFVMSALMSRRPSFFLAVILSWAMPMAVYGQWGGSEPAQEGWASQPQANSPGAPQTESDPALRLGRLEEQIRALNGKVEQLEFKNRTLEEQVKRYQEDAEFRFQAVESGKKGAAPPKRQQRSEAPISPPLPTADDGGDTNDNDNETNVSLAPVETESNRPPQLGDPPRNLGELPASSDGNPIDLAPGTVSQPLEPLPGAITEEPRPGYMPNSKQGAVSAPSDNPKDQYDLAYGYMLRGDYEMAEISFKDFLADHPKSENSAQAAYWLGESQYQRKQYKAAAESFLKVYNDHPGAPKAPESLLRLGMSLKALGQKDAACASYAEVIRKYPKAGAAVKKRVQTEQRSAGC